LRRSRFPVGHRSDLRSDLGEPGATVSALNPPNLLSAGALFSTCPDPGRPPGDFGLSPFRIQVGEDLLDDIEGLNARNHPHRTAAGQAGLDKVN
jgi:hypothetical protein